jgi:hypothetical protein
MTQIQYSKIYGKYVANVMAKIQLTVLQNTISLTKWERDTSLLLNPSRGILENLTAHIWSRNSRSRQLSTGSYPESDASVHHPHKLFP